MPFRHLLLAITVAGLLATSAAATSPTGPQSVAPVTPREVMGEPVGPEEYLGANAIAQAQATEDPVARAAALDRALSLLPRPTRLRGKLQCARALLAIAAEGGDEGAQNAALSKMRPAIAECFRLVPDDSAVLWLEASARLDEKDLRGATMLFIRAVEIGGAPAATIFGDDFDSILRQLSYAGMTAERERLLTTLAKAGWGRDDPARLSTQLLPTIESRLKAGDKAGALAMLPNVLDPEVGLRMLVDRGFEPIWPQLEEWAGRDMEAQRTAFRAAARAQFDIDPSLVNRRIYVDALVDTGDRAQGERLLAEALADPAQWDDDRYYAASTASRYAGLLTEDGRGAEALTALLRFEVQAPKEKYAATLNIMPNRVRTLLRLKRYAEALQVLDAQTPKVDQVESPGSMAFYDALRSCALAGLGRARESAELRDGLLSSSTGNDAARDIALRCSGDKKLLAARWLRRLTQERASALLDYVQATRQAQPPEIAGDPAVVAMRLIIDEPAVREAFQAKARDLPASFDPALRHWGIVPTAPQ